MPTPPFKEEPQSLLGRMSREKALREVAWVAEFLSVSKAWVHDATAAGTLPSIRVGEEVRYDPDAIKAWGRGTAAPAPSSERLLPYLEAISADVKALKGQQRSPALLMSFRQAAKLLKVDRITTLKVLLESGQLKTVMVNGKQRIHRAEVERLAAAGFDRDAPRKRTRAKRITGDDPAELQASILKLKF